MDTCSIKVPLAKQLEWGMSALLSVAGLVVGIVGLAGGFSLVNSCFYTSLVTLVLGTWVQVPSMVDDDGTGHARSMLRLVAVWTMSTLVTLIVFGVGVAGLAGRFSVTDNCFYPGLITLILGTWVPG